MERRRQIKFVGNCQASAMANFYREQIGAVNLEDVYYIDDLGLEIDDIQLRLADADVAILQERDFKRDIPVDETRTTIYRFPMIVAGFLWPFANEPHVSNVAERPISDGPYPSQMGDSFLNRLIVKGVSPEEALEQYRTLDIAKVAHLDRLKEIYLDKQRERDRATGYAIADEIDARFRTERLFLTAEHPDAYLFSLLAGRLFEQMGIAKEEIERALRSLSRSPFPPTELPLHPGVIAHFGLSFAGDDRRYRYLDEGRFSFEEYVLRYMRYENNPELRRALYMLWQDAPNRSLEMLDAALVGSPSSARGMAARAALLDHLGRREEALAGYCAAIEAEPDSPQFYTDYGDALMRAGQPDQAEAQAITALGIDPRWPKAHLCIAEIRIHSGDFEGALPYARQALELRPGDAAACRSLAIAYTVAGASSHAETLARKSMAMEPLVPDHRNLVAEILEQQSQRDEALALLKAGVEIGCSNDQTFSLLGNLHLRNGQLEEAEAAFEIGYERYGELRPDLGCGLVDVRRLRAGAAAL